MADYENKSSLRKYVHIFVFLIVSESTVEGSCIFPLSSVAFLILYMSDILKGDEDDDENGCGFLECVTAR